MKHQLFSERLRQLRQRMGWSQEELSNKLGVSRNYVGMMENGREAGETLVKLFDLIERQCATETVAQSPRQLIRAARLAKKLSFSDLAKLTRYSADVLQAIEEGNGQASERMIEAISAALGLSKHDLMEGSDETIVREALNGTYGATPDLDVTDGVGRPRYVPLLSMAQAGSMSGSAFTDGGYNHEGALAFAPQDRRAFAVKIVGDSMQPTYAEGDVAVVYPSRPPRNGDCVLARLSDDAGGDVMFKLYSVRDGGNRVVLSSYNTVYPPLDYPRKEFLWIYPVAAVTRMLMK